MALSHYMSLKRDGYIRRLNEYFERRSAQGLGVPQSSRTPGRWSAAAIADGTGIQDSTLEGSPALRKCIEEWIIKIGFSPSENRARELESPWARARDYKERVGAYIVKLRQDGRKIPENPRCLGRPYWEKIASEAGVSVLAFSRNTTAKKLIHEALPELGLEIRQDVEECYSISYGELLILGTNWRAKELEGLPHANQRVYNARTHLRRFMRIAGQIHKATEFTKEDRVGSEMLEQFNETVHSVTIQIKNKNTRRKFSEEITRWQNYYVVQLESKILPSKFSEALDVALLRKGMSVNQLADAAEIKKANIYTWINGGRYPAIENYPDVRRVEQVLSLLPDTLISRLITTRPKCFPTLSYPEYITIGNSQIKIRGNKGILDHLRPLLPIDFDERPDVERVEVVTWLIENLVLPTTEWGRWNRSIREVPFALKKLPPIVEEEWEELKKFKCAKLTPRNMKRSGSWNTYTEDTSRYEIKMLMGFLTLSPDAEDERLRGPGLRSLLFTLAMLTCDTFIDEWIRWRAKRRAKEVESDNKMQESYSSIDFKIAHSMASHFDPETGWFTQKPELALHLKPIPGYIDDTFIQRARVDWAGVCGDAHLKYKSLADMLEEIVEEQRDPFEVIISLLDVDHPQYHNPFSALRFFSQSIIDDLPNPAVAPIRSARHVRNYLIVRILCATALRSRHIRELTYREDNSGNLRRRGDEWVIVIPWQWFKNKNSPFFGNKRKKFDYEKVLTDKDGLYQWIEKYLTEHRPVLLDGKESDLFFVSSAERPLFSPSQFHIIYRRLTMRYFAYNPYKNRGIPGVKPHGPHAVRDMTATFVLQTTGSYELAGDSIQDTAQTTREHYGRFTPKDKTKLINKIIERAWDGESDENLAILNSIDSD
jgi:integrase